MRVSLLYLGSTGAGPVYSLEMAKAIYITNKCDLQIIISENCYNLDLWKKYFKSTKVQLEIVKTYKRTPIHLALSFVAFSRHRRIINLIKNFKPEYVYVPFHLTWAPILYPLLSKFTKIVSTIHDPHPHDRPKNFLRSYLTKIVDGSYDNVTSIILLNTTDVDYIKKKYQKEVFVIPHASFSYYANTKHITRDISIKKKIGFIGRIEPYKGLDLLINAFSKLSDKNIKLLIAGSGDVSKDILSYINNNSNIELINRYIRDEEFESIMNQVDFIVLPYKRASQSGVIPLSFAFGKTVVVTNVGSLSEQVPDGTGLVVDANVAAICDAIEYLYANSDIILKYCNSAKKYAESELSWEHSAELLFNVFQYYKTYQVDQR